VYANLITLMQLKVRVKFVITNAWTVWERQLSVLVVHRAISEFIKVQHILVIVYSDTLKMEWLCVLNVTTRVYLVKQKKLNVQAVHSLHLEH
jgi:hypothetical protein